MAIWIDKDKLTTALCESCQFCKNNEPCEDCEVMAVIEEQPVIRCSVCIHFNNGQCRLIGRRSRLPNDFCSSGERRSDDSKP